MKKSKLSRRDFVRKSAGAAMMLSLPTIIPASAFGANDKVQVAVLGVNGRGTDHIKGFGKQNNAQVVCLCDPDLVVLNTRAGEFEKTYGRKVKMQQDLRKVFEDK
ncbi:MAG TPA: gfo/Idh/MocA family oxidoreductase, partial [Cyclobacteriaceae bacterium]|nr:gfo/Idh/MocA family oxidoreductase [Cyclobacteriaceae bacterium]